MPGITSGQICSAVILAHSLKAGEFDILFDIVPQLQMWVRILKKPGADPLPGGCEERREGLGAHPDPEIGCEGHLEVSFCRKMGQSEVRDRKQPASHLWPGPTAQGAHMCGLPSPQLGSFHSFPCFW